MDTKVARREEGLATWKGQPNWCFHTAFITGPRRYTSPLVVRPGLGRGQ